jgi:PKD domain
VLALIAALAGAALLLIPEGAHANVSSLQAVSVQATATQPFNGTVATFSSGDTGPFAVTINWGDGSSSSETFSPVKGSTYDVPGAHTYAHEGTYPFSVTVVDQSDKTSASVKGTATVADAPLSAQGTNVSATAGQPFSGAVATFSDADTSAVASNFTATIDWGDGSTSPGTVVTSGTGFAVEGSHTWVSAGTFTVTVMIEDSGGASAQATSSATVAQGSSPPPPPPPPPSPMNPTAVIKPLAFVPLAGAGAIFDGSGSSAGLVNGSIVSYSWTFSDSSRASVVCPATQAAVYHHFTAAGTVKVQLTVRDSSGRSGTVSSTVIVAPDLVSRAGTPLNDAARATSSCVPAEVEKQEPSVVARPVTADIVEPQINGMEVTQGIQDNPDAPLVSTSEGPEPINNTVPRSDPTYYGVRLVQGKPTVVRVYANAWIAPPGGIRNATVTLSGVDDRTGQSLGAPLSAIEGSQTLQPGPPYVSLGDRTQASGTSNAVFSFQLPDSWTAHQQVSLTATLTAASDPGYLMCSTDRCTQLQSFTLQSVAFHGVRPVIVAPDIVQVDTSATSGVVDPLSGPDPGESPPDPNKAFGDTAALLPAPLIIDPYRSTFDASPAWFGTCVDGAGPGCDTSGYILGLLQNDVLHSGLYMRTVPFAVTGNPTEMRPQGPQWFNGLTYVHGGLYWGSFCVIGVSPDPCLLPGFPVAQAGEDRPLNGIAHEFGHALTLMHASPGCDGNLPGTGGAVSWPPDQYGYINGIGLDVGHVLGPPPPGVPFEPVAGTPPGSPSCNPTPPPAFPQAKCENAQFFDYMSYCATNADAWISARNWDSLEQYLQSGTAVAGVSPSADVAAGTSGLSVTATMINGHVQIIDVHPAGRRAGHLPSSPTFALQARDGAGHVLESSPMVVSEGHVDQRTGPPLLEAMLSGVIPAAAATRSVDITDGQIVASRARPPHRPTARFLGFRPGLVLGKRDQVTIRWRAAGAGHAALNAELDYSRDGGRTWRTLFMGPSLRKLTLPRYYFTRSSQARLRLIVNDGFDATTAVSPPLRSLGAPPLARIESAVARGAVRGELSTNLSAWAFDDAGRPLAGEQLRWYVGRKLLGTGAHLSVTGLPAGHDRIRLQVRDSIGRTATASIALTVRPARAEFTLLRVPTAIAPGAKYATMRIAASAPGIVSVQGQSFAVSPRPRRITVPCRAGSGPLLLRLRLRIGHASAHARVRISR